MKKIVSLLLACVMMLGMVLPAHAGTADEWYDMVIEDAEDSLGEEEVISPQTEYIMTVDTTISNLGSGKIGILCNVYCNQSVKSIVAVFSLQKLSWGSWKTVSSGTTSVSNTNKLSKSATISGVSSGTYRAKVVAKVTDSNGHAETLTGYSGSITI